jgi:hypothetical protein
VLVPDVSATEMARMLMLSLARHSLTERNIPGTFSRIMDTCFTHTDAPLYNVSK